MQQRLKRSDISYKCQFLGRPIFPHGQNGIFISGDAVIGKNAVIFHQVTIGSNRIIDSKGFGAPFIGDNCYIGAGAKIIGNVKIGKNCRIGANAVVTKNVPDNSTVVAGEMRIISHDHDLDNRYVTKDINGQWVAWNNGYYEKVEIEQESEIE